MFQPGGTASLPIIVIGIDEDTISKYGQYVTWERDIYTKVLDRIHELCEPSVVAYDILFTQNKDPEKDRMFVEACEKYGDVLAGAYFDYGKQRVTLANYEYDERFIAKSAIFPFEALKNVTMLGNTDNGLSDDGYARTLSPYVEYNSAYIENRTEDEIIGDTSIFDNDSLMESFALVAYKAYRNKIGDPYDTAGLYELKARAKEEEKNIYFTYTTKPFA